MDVERMMIVKKVDMWVLTYWRKDGNEIGIAESDILTDMLDAWIYVYNQNADLDGVDHRRFK